jgi:transposase-like protein
MSDPLREIVSATINSLRGAAPAPAELEQAVRAVLGNLSTRHAGETLRIYVPRDPAHQRAERARQIREAARSGAPMSSIASTFGLSIRHVHRLVR